MLKPIFAAMLIVGGCFSSIDGSNCSGGQDANSSFFSKSFVFGYGPNGPSPDTQGDFGIYIITQTETQVAILRPFNLGGPLRPIPNVQHISIGAPYAVGTEAGQEKEVIFVQAQADSALMAYSGEPWGDSYGAYAVIPAAYLGQEYFVFVRTQPSSAFVVISALDSLTRMKMRFNAFAVIKGVTYERGDEVEFYLRAWTQLMIHTQTDEFSGSRILTNRPVSVITGTKCAFAPNESSGCDHIIEQLTPFDRWGTIFNIPVFPYDDDFYILIVAGRDDTIVTTVNLDFQTEVVSELDHGESELLYTNQTMVRLNSNKPIQVVALKTRNAAMVTIPPEEQYVTGDTYIYVPDANNYGVTTYDITITASCEFEQLFSVYKLLPNDFGDPEVMSAYETMRHAGICSLYYDVYENYTYKINSSDPSTPYYALLTSYCSETAAASVGAQRFRKLRCIDYDSMFNEANASYRSSSYSLAFKDHLIRREPDQQYFFRTSLGCANACAHPADSHCKVFTWSKLSGDCKLYGSFNARADLHPQIGSHVYRMV